MVLIIGETLLLGMLVEIVIMMIDRAHRGLVPPLHLTDIPTIASNRQSNIIFSAYYLHKYLHYFKMCYKKKVRFDLKLPWLFVFEQYLHYILLYFSHLGTVSVNPA